jgi:phosphatidylserine decarboxylase
MVVRQIAGAIARRIVCTLKPGDELARGERFGMIKFGSRTELIVPWDERLEILVNVKDKVRGGASVLGRYVDA